MVRAICLFVLQSLSCLFFSGLGRGMSPTSKCPRSSYELPVRCTNGKGGPGQRLEGKARVLLPTSPPFFGWCPRQWLYFCHCSSPAPIWAPNCVPWSRRVAPSPPLGTSFPPPPSFCPKGRGTFQLHKSWVASPFQCPWQQTFQPL